MSEPGERPRPQYGEYATPEEQRARIKQPDLTRLLETGQDPDALHGAVPADSPSLATKPATAPAAGAMTRGRFTDRVVTIALLVYALVNVVTSIPSMIDYGGYVSTVLNLLGVDGELADPAAGRPWGVTAALVLAIGWLLTAYVSWRSLARGRITWWIPLVAGAVFTVITGVLLMVPIVSDPTLWNAILDSAR
ncbi:DUF6264 family protein [uncultured Microbacterium sp.]|uniref:DUF6264 family protein n=1 Tax=uncultured Microbacterium sp. TaxID=191216 RepID=UPI0028D1791B|nr:DUF6264 family protein [uncultured Microbacterium sp.]